jgi:hypothetical protein
LSQTIRSRLALAHPSDSFIDASLSGLLAENDDTFAITKSVRNLRQVAEGLSDGSNSLTLNGEMSEWLKEHA